MLGVAGSQGSGKSTLAAQLAAEFGGVALSLDDVYLTRAQRLDLARRVHPLFVTRGPPCTHDLELLGQVLDSLCAAAPDTLMALPVFDKLADERVDEDRWPVFLGRPRVIILEGWCLGAQAEPDDRLATAVNTLEAEADPECYWREAVNTALKQDYARLHARLDGLVFLRAPDFDTVLDWRCQQETALLGVSQIAAGRRAALSRFVAHFQRLTLWMMQGGIKADLVIDLDRDRRVLAIAGPPTT